MTVSNPYSSSNAYDVTYSAMKLLISLNYFFTSSLSTLGVDKL